MFCLDTTYFIDLIRNSKIIKPITKKIEREPLFTTTFNLFETQIGSYSIKNEEFRNKAIEKLNKAFDRMEVLPFLKEDALKAAEIAGILRRKGKIVGADAIIAAIALNNGCTVVTRNYNHFQWLSEETGLEVIFY
jgi:predicted nucleic acid-binding protein